MVIVLIINVLQLAERVVLFTMEEHVLEILLNLHVDQHMKFCQQLYTKLDLLAILQLVNVRKYYHQYRKHHNKTNIVKEFFFSIQ